MRQNLEADRLSQISTRWTEIIQANCPNGQSRSAAFEAQKQILLRYGAPIHRYLLAATRDAEIAEELTQEFALRFIRGDLKNASPLRGRFRDYLKTVLRNIVNDYFRKKKKERFNPIDELFDESGLQTLEESFNESWRQKMLEQSWTRLSEYSQSRDNHYYAVLSLRAAQPQANSAALARLLSEQLNQAISADWIRQNLRRARTKFCEILIAEVASTLGVDATREEIECELASLRLLKYTAVEHAK